MNEWREQPAAGVTPRFEALRTEAHVWLTDPDDPGVTGRLAALEHLLDEEERGRHRRFLHERDRRLFLVAHSLLRRTLSRYVDAAPETWVFRTDNHGRPEIRHPTTAQPLRFNLAHTRGLAGCVVAVDMPVGIDVERPRSIRDLPNLARLTLTEGEFLEFLSLAPEERPERFLTRWVLKEAYSKARGLGLSLPMRSFGFVLDDSGRILLVPPSGDDVGDWQFQTSRPAAGHCLAVAIRRGRGPDRAIRIQWDRFSDVIPGTGDRQRNPAPGGRHQVWSSPG